MTNEEHERELEQGTVGRSLRRQMKAERHAASAAVATHQGPYETTYDTSLGYCSDRAIIRP
jgi:hypothetical protein